MYTITPYSRYIYIDDMIVAVEADKQGVTMGECSVSGLMFEDDSVTNSKNTRRIAEIDTEYTTW